MVLRIWLPVNSRQAQQNMVSTQAWPQTMGAEAMTSTAHDKTFFSFISSMSSSKYFLPTSMTTSEYIWMKRR